MGCMTSADETLAKRPRIPRAGALDETEEQAEAEEFAAQATEPFATGEEEHPATAMEANQSRRRATGRGDFGGKRAAPPQQPFQARVRDDFRSRDAASRARGGRDRGRRDDRGGVRNMAAWPQRQDTATALAGTSSPATAARRPQLIADMLKQGQEIIVQIAKEPLGKKGARITSHVALPGRFLVYMPTLDHTGVSRKIASAEDRARLRHLVNDAKGSAGGGFIVRTAAASAAPEESSRGRGIPDAHVGRNQGAFGTAQGSFDAAPRPEPGGAHPARLHHRRFTRHLGGHRRGIHQGGRLHEPLPAAAGGPREALHQGNAGLRGIRHPAGNRQGRCARRCG